MFLSSSFIPLFNPWKLKIMVVRLVFVKSPSISPFFGIVGNGFPFDFNIQSVELSDDVLL